MFAFRDTVPAVNPVRVAFTDGSLNLQSGRPGFEEDYANLCATAGVEFAWVSQCHGADVARVWMAGQVPERADALVSTERGLGLMIRVADCVPLLLADADHRVIAAVHSGRPGMALNIAAQAVSAMRDLGAREIRGWIGPHVCGGCYEVPEEMRADVAEQVPAAYAVTRWGTPALDIGAGLKAQLDELSVPYVDAARCTMEDAGLHSYRRDGAASGRMAGLIWLG